MLDDNWAFDYDWQMDWQMDWLSCWRVLAIEVAERQYRELLGDLW